ncbi:hypothetical protein ACFXKS_35165 [Streptomyces scopuliridis]|uniref:hypothetical protein n=1 Tax=Streptomyces scopuliridis TaxID=452529 RepID=UPI00369D737D
MTTTSTQPPATRRGLEVTTVFFAATTAGLTAGIVVALCHAPALAIMGSGGATFGVAFTVGMKVFEYLNNDN